MTVAELDEWWNATVASLRHPALDLLSFALDVWGAGALGFGLFPALLLTPLLIGRRFRASVVFLAVGVTSLVIVQTLKPLIDSARPGNMLTESDAGSFPSGHVTNAATLCVFIALVYRSAAVWAAAAVYVAAMAFARTYVHAHWLSDVTAGVVLGTVLACAAYAVMNISQKKELRDLRPRPAD